VVLRIRSVRVLCGAAAWLRNPQSEVPWKTCRRSRARAAFMAVAGRRRIHDAGFHHQPADAKRGRGAVSVDLPLAVYLLSFIICFESPRWYKRGLFLRLLAIALASLAYALYDIQVSEAIPVAIPLFTIGLFLTCMFCHGELSRLKPGAAQLTSFYLMIALGGALGAISPG